MSKNKEFIQEINRLEREEREKIARAEEFKIEIKNLEAKLDDLKNFRLKLNTNDRNDIYNVLKRLKEVNESINRVDIPSEITIQKKTSLELSDATRYFLVWYFVISFLVIFGISAFAFWRISEAENQVRFLQKNNLSIPQQKWLKNFYQFQAKKNPKDTQKFILEHPLEK